MTEGVFAGLASLDGDLRPVEEACIPVTDRGVTLGDAVFETLRTYGGRLFALSEHLERLGSSMDAIRLTERPPPATIAAWARTATHAAMGRIRDDGVLPEGTEAVVRITVTRGDGPHGLSLKGTGPPRTLVLARPLRPTPARVYSEGLRVVTATTRRHHPAAQDPRVKATSALNLVMARAEADAAEADEALLLDGAGRYLEASAANLFVLKDGTYWTPRGEDGVLPGITASIVSATLDAMGLDVVRAPIPPEVLRDADEVFLTQTTREAIPVVAVDGRAVADGRPGATTHEVRRRFLAEVPKWLDTEGDA